MMGSKPGRGISKGAVQYRLISLPTESPHDHPSISNTSCSLPPAFSNLGQSEASVHGQNPLPCSGSKGDLRVSCLERSQFEK